MKTKLIILCCFIFFISFVYSQQLNQKKTNIAVLDFDAREGVGKGEAASLSDIFCSQLVQTGNYVVVDRNRIKAILTEQGFQQSEACSSIECIVEAGKILQVEKMFAGVIGKIGRLYTVSIQMIDVTTGQIQANKSRQHEGDIEELAKTIIPEIALEMSQSQNVSTNLSQTIYSEKKSYKVKEITVAFGGGNYKGKPLFNFTDKILIIPKNIGSIGFYYNLGKYYALGINIGGFRQTLSNISIDTIKKSFNFDVACNFLEIDNRFILTRGSVEPYIGISLINSFGSLDSDLFLENIKYSGIGVGFTLGLKFAISDNFTIALEGISKQSTPKWDGAPRFSRIVSKNIINGDTIDASYTAMFIRFTYQWGS